MDVREYNLLFDGQPIVAIKNGFASFSPKEGSGVNLTLLDTKTLERITRIKGLDSFSLGVATGAWRVKGEWEEAGFSRPRGFVHIKEIIKQRLVRKAQ